MRKAARRDANEPRIRRFLERCGCTVVPINQDKIPDLLVGYGSMVNLLLEVKSDTGKLTEGQITFFDTWCGQKDIVRTISDVKEVLRRISNTYVYRCDICGKKEITYRTEEHGFTCTCGNKLERFPASLYCIE